MKSNWSIHKVGSYKWLNIGTYNLILKYVHTITHSRCYFVGDTFFFVKGNICVTSLSFFYIPIENKELTLVTVVPTHFFLGVVFQDLVLYEFKFLLFYILKENN